MGRVLARRTADRVWIEDQGRVVLRIGVRVVPGTEIRRRPLSLLCYLLTRPGLSATRDQVIDAMWPESDPGQAVNSLHQTIYFLRRIIEPAALRDEWGTPGGLTGRYYSIAASQELLYGVSPPLAIEALTPQVVRLTPRVDFGSGTESVAGDGSVLDRGGTGGNPFGGLGIDVGADQIAAVWTGYIDTALSEYMKDVRRPMP